MDEIQSNINKALAEAQKVRDELAVKSALVRPLPKTNLLNSMTDMNFLKTKSQKIFDVADDSARCIKIAAEMGIEAKSKEEVMLALELAAEEIKYSYNKIQNFIF